MISRPTPARLATLLALLFAGAGLAACGSTSSEEPIPWVNQGNNQSNNQTPDNQNNQNQNNQNQNPTNQNPTNQTNPGDAGVITLFDETVSLINGYATEAIEFQVPDNVLSVAITISDGPPNAQYAVTGWTGPGNFPIVPSGWESSGSGMCYPNCNNRIILNVASFGGLAPNNPDSRVEPGNHRFFPIGFAVSGWSMSPLTAGVRVKVMAKTISDEVPDTGVMDLNIYFTGSNGWTAETAQNDPSFAAMLQQVDALYDQVGVDLGEITYNDAPSNLQVIQDHSSGSGDLSQLFASSADAPLEHGLNLFFVHELRSPFGEILGIAGGIPGPVLKHGTGRSGVAVATSSVGTPGAPSLAHTVAHELGHYLGLFHTSEYFSMGGTPEHDPLPDTPPNDTSYLMHASGEGNNMSPWQGRVIRKNPFIRHP